MTTEPSPEAKAIAYVEGLGLNSVYESAVEARDRLDEKHTELAFLRQKRRGTEEKKADLELAVIEDERARHPSMSQAQMDKHLKVAFANNGDIREAKDRLVTLAGEIDLVEFEIDQIHQDIKIAVARLEELGGYFQFMAVIKQAELTRKANEIRDRNPWHDSSKH